MTSNSLKGEKWPWVSPSSSVEHLERKNWPKISIVTPSYNQGEYIEETILSVINQNYPNLEYIIIDGGSTDNTIDIIKKYEKHITYWVSEPDRGQSHAINKGLKKCTGDVFNWLNSDDFYEPGALREVGRIFQDEKWLVVTGGRKFIDSEGKIKFTSNNTLRNTLEETIGQLQFGQPSTFFERKAFEKMGSVREDMNYMMDVAWWVTFLLTFGQSGVKRLDKNLVNFRLHGSSKTVSQEAGFLKDRKSIELSLLKCLNTSHNLLVLLKTVYSQSNREINWDVSAEINRGLLISIILCRIAHYLYSHGKLREAKACMLYIKEHNLSFYESNSSIADLSRKLRIPFFLLRVAKKLNLQTNAQWFYKKQQRFVFKQQSLFQEALNELGMKGNVSVNHQKATCYLNEKEYHLIFPLRYFKKIRNLSKEKKYLYTFTGKETEGREWVKSFKKGSLINFTEKGREIPKDYLDTDYYQTMCQSRFTLCPKGDFKWTYRFFEAIMCRSIPVIEKEGVDSSMDGFAYFYQDAISSHRYDEDICDSNYRRLVARHSLIPEVLDITL